MPQARDEAGNVWEVDAQGNPVRLIQAAEGQGRIIPQQADPYEQSRMDRDQRDYRTDRGDEAFNRATTLRNEYRKSEGVVTYEAALGTFNAAMNTAESSQGDQSLITAYAKMLDPNSAVREGEFATTASTERTIDQLRAKLAKEFGWEQGGMITPEGRAAIREEMRNLVVSRFQPAYERQRSYYQRLAGEYGIPAERVVVDDIESRFPEGMLDPPKVEETNIVATGNTKADKLPQEYQDAHYAYLSQNWGNIDPDDYARFRTALDERYGQNPNPDAYRAAVPTFNNAASEGQRPGDLGAVPSPTSEMGFFEGAMNSAAQSPAGAFGANMGNAGTGGLLAELTGTRDQLEDIRDINPGWSMAGEIGGGITGTVMGGKALQGIGNTMKAGRAASILKNPTTANLAYGTTYGATQDRENRLRGAAIGGAAAFAGDVAGRAIGGAFPNTFNRSGLKQADESVPTVEELQEAANRQYMASEQAGSVADATATSDMLQRANRVLSEDGYIGPQGDIVGSGPIAEAAKLLRQYDGQPMTPTQAGATRKAIGRARTAMDGTQPDYAQRRTAGRMLNEFDEWAEPVLPGVEEARATAQRAILGREMQAARDVSEAKSAMYSQSGEENAIRSAFRKLDLDEVRGRNSYPEGLSKKIQEVSRGTPASNAARWAGKFAPTSGVGTLPSIGAAGVGASAFGGPAGAIAGVGVAGGGLFGRKVATNMTQRSAQEAELIARGGEDYIEELAKAIAKARARGGAIGAGMAVPGASMPTRGGN